MDEPTAFLDIASKHEIMHLLHKLTRYTGKTIIYSTHDFSMALNQSDKMWLVTEDRLIEGAPEDLVLNGEFEHLFEAPHVRFEPETGNFVFKGEQNGQVYVCGNSAGRKWIERALLRAGILVTDNITDTYIDTGTANNTVWKLCRGDSQVVCTSVYDLINRLKQELR
jgi:iron complex transport system ATP-binding protein